eukprot:TRINITY_DN681_c4_g1_i1.p1 TRINITY_DN681_c4_g1~~TRINITY_DN681_c4_g1_i1.p1  ORF type:complete len:1552 (+),score=325.79 TRINITY_DN681_c4_g1_i1:115-4656(+)
MLGLVSVIPTAEALQVTWKSSAGYDSLGGLPGSFDDKESVVEVVTSECEMVVIGKWPGKGIQLTLDNPVVAESDSLTNIRNSDYALNYNLTTGANIDAHGDPLLGFFINTPSMTFNVSGTPPCSTHIVACSENSLHSNYTYIAYTIGPCLEHSDLSIQIFVGAPAVLIMFLIVVFGCVPFFKHRSQCSQMHTAIEEEEEGEKNEENEEEKEQPINENNSTSERQSSSEQKEVVDGNEVAGISEDAQTIETTEIIEITGTDQTEDVVEEYKENCTAEPTFDNGPRVTLPIRVILMVTYWIYASLAICLWIPPIMGKDILDKITLTGNSTMIALVPLAVLFSVIVGVGGCFGYVVLLDRNKYENDEVPQREESMPSEDKQQIESRHSSQVRLIEHGNVTVIVPHEEQEEEEQQQQQQVMVKESNEDQPESPTHDVVEPYIEHEAVAEDLPVIDSYMEHSTGAASLRAFIDRQSKNGQHSGPDPDVSPAGMVVARLRARQQRSEAASRYNKQAGIPMGSYQAAAHPPAPRTDIWSQLQIGGGRGDASQLRSMIYDRQQQPPQLQQQQQHYPQPSSEFTRDQERQFLRERAQQASVAQARPTVNPFAPPERTYVMQPQFPLQPDLSQLSDPDDEQPSPDPPGQVMAADPPPPSPPQRTVLIESHETYIRTGQSSSFSKVVSAAVATENIASRMVLSRTSDKRIQELEPQQELEEEQEQEEQEEEQEPKSEAVAEVEEVEEATDEKPEEQNEEVTEIKEQESTNQQTDSLGTDNYSELSSGTVVTTPVRIEFFFPPYPITPQIELRLRFDLADTLLINQKCLGDMTLNMTDDPNRVTFYVQTTVSSKSEPCFTGITELAGIKIKSIRTRSYREADVHPSTTFSKRYQLHSPDRHELLDTPTFDEITQVVSSTLGIESSAIISFSVSIQSTHHAVLQLSVSTQEEPSWDLLRTVGHFEIKESTTRGIEVDVKWKDPEKRLNENDFMVELSDLVGINDTEVEGLWGIESGDQETDSSRVYMTVAEGCPVHPSLWRLRCADKADSVSWSITRVSPSHAVPTGSATALSLEFDTETKNVEEVLGILSTMKSTHGYYTISINAGKCVVVIPEEASFAHTEELPVSSNLHCFSCDYRLVSGSVLREYHTSDLYEDVARQLNIFSWDVISVHSVVEDDDEKIVVITCLPREPEWDRVTSIGGFLVELVDCDRGISVEIAKSDCESSQVIKGAPYGMLAALGCLQLAQSLVALFLLGVITEDSANGLVIICASVGIVLIAAASGYATTVVATGCSYQILFSLLLAYIFVKRKDWPVADAAVFAFCVSVLVGAFFCIKYTMSAIFLNKVAGLMITISFATYYARVVPFELFPLSVLLGMVILSGMAIWKQNNPRYNQLLIGTAACIAIWEVVFRVFPQPDSSPPPSQVFIPLWCVILGVARLVDCSPLTVEGSLFPIISTIISLVTIVTYACWTITTSVINLTGLVTLIVEVIVSLFLVQPALVLLALFVVKSLRDTTTLDVLKVYL